jgi:hypothetical protein
MDLSAFGACLSVGSRVETGSVLRLRLSNREQLLRHEVTIRVTHAHQPASTFCLAGGPFEEPLPSSVLEALLR